MKDRELELLHKIEKDLKFITEHREKSDDRPGLYHLLQIAEQTTYLARRNINTSGKE